MSKNSKNKKERRGMPLLGDKFPEMKVVTTRGELDLPKHFAKKWFVLFSHPADFTPVCTTEFVAFQNRYKQFKKLNCELIGLSVDQVFSHLKWEEWIKDNLKVEIQFPIIADTGMVAKKMGLNKDVQPGGEKIAVERISVNSIFPTLTSFYKKNGIGYIQIKNSSKKKIVNVSATYFLNDKVIGTSEIKEIPKQRSYKLLIKPKPYVMFPSFTCV